MNASMDQIKNLAEVGDARIRCESFMQTEKGKLRNEFQKRKNGKGENDFPSFSLTIESLTAMLRNFMNFFSTISWSLTNNCKSFFACSSILILFDYEVTDISQWHKELVYHLNKFSNFLSLRTTYKSCWKIGLRRQFEEFFRRRNMRVLLIFVISACTVISAQDCPPKETYNSCGPSCETTCDDILHSRNVTSLGACVSGCFCNKNFVRSVRGGACVRIIKCSR